MSDTVVKERASVRTAVQKLGTFLSGMVMPNIPALIAWGIVTALFIEVGPFPNEAIASLVDPAIHYLLPLLIAYTGGKMVYDVRGGVVGSFATLGVIGGSDWLIDQFNANAAEGEGGLGKVHMFIGAMIMAPLAAWLMKQLDKLWEGKVKAGFEMLVNMFSAGIFAFIMALGGFFLLAPVVNKIMEWLGAGVGWLIETGVLPAVSLLIEPAKVFFLNNAINHGVLTPLGSSEAAVDGKSILFLLEANPGPGVGVLLAFTFFGVGAARATAPGAAIIQFFGGIHEVYFPYVLMKPALLLAVIGGGASGVATNMLLGTGLGGPAAPGSIIAVGAQAIGPGVMNFIGVMASVVVAAAVSFIIAAVILRASRKGDLAAEAAGQDSLGAAVAKTQANKGKESSFLSGLSTAVMTEPITRIVFACDAGMGSSAMGASVLRKKVHGAGFTDVTVTNLAIANLDDTPQVVITQEELTPRAKQQNSSAVHVSVDNFMNSPRYDEVVELVRQSREEGDAAGGETASAEADAPVAAAAAAPAAAGPGDVLTPDRVTTAPAARNRDDAIREAAGRLVAAGAVTGAYEQAMFDREAEVSTFMGNGLAIPHGTNAAKETVLGSALTVARYPEPIDWDGNEVRFVIGIAGKDGGHLEILAKIATIFSDEAQVERLLAAEGDAELYAMLSEVND
ncbi:MAG: PTS mannitol transporter subunit IICBA [Agrococcus casei]|uniref:PTS mannitol transporter subunit IICBA n=1 Tax=Agrococcus casei TaxID=343512 RepID=UPI003F932B99